MNRLNVICLILLSMSALGYSTAIAAPATVKTVTPKAIPVARRPCKCRGNEASLKKRLVEETAHDPQSDKAAEAMLALADFYRYDRKFDLAEDYFKKARAIKERIYGKEALETAFVLARMGLLYTEWNKPAEAKTEIAAALKVLQGNLGKRDIRQAAILDEIGDLYSYQSQTEKAKEYLHKALNLREEWLGPDSIVLADGLDRLAQLYFSASGYPEAERLLRRSAEIRHKKQAGSLRESATMQLLAGSLMKQERYGEACVVIADAAKIERRLPGEHPQLILTAQTFAEELRRQNELAEAKKLEAIASSLSKLSTTAATK